MNEVREIQLRDYGRSENFIKDMSENYIKDRPRQGEIWTVKLEEKKDQGHVIYKTRPCIIVQKDELNEKLLTTLIIPISSKEMVSMDNEFEITEDLIEFFRFPEGVKGKGCATKTTSVDMRILGRFIGKLNPTGLKLLREKVDNVI